MKPKTNEIRARELYKLVYPGFQYDYEPAVARAGWLKLGKMVLELERKWTKARKRKNKWTQTKQTTPD